MKVQLKYNQLTYSGKLDDLIYYYHPGIGELLARKRPVRVQITAANEHFAAVSKNLNKLIQNPEYKLDLKIYLDLLQEAGEVGRGMNWYSLFTRMMWKLAELAPEVDLAVLSRAEVIDISLPCITVKAAVEAGLLPKVEGYQRLENGM